MGLEVRAFGPMEIMRGGVAVRLRSRQQQLLLALLLVRRGSVVPVSVLTDALWPARPPIRVEKSLQIHVHRLRGALGDVSAVQHRPPGYAVALPQSGADLFRFEELRQRGRAALVSGDEVTAAELLRQATELHREPAFQGLDHVMELAIESRRLAELRLAALEDRIAAELALGRHTGVVAELAALVAAHPLRERFRAQLMTALYRSGRKADALAAYRHGRQVLMEDLGVEPSEECQALERAILADYPSLRNQPARSAPAPPARPAAPLTPPRHLPADVPGFTGRASELHRLDEGLDEEFAEQPAARRAVFLLEGTAGVGKTALAVHWAHRAREQFPDGQLYLNLRGYAAGAPPLAPIQALSGFLRALGVPPDQVPPDLDEAAAAYRSQLADRAVLVLLDNAASADQVRPLLPAGERCLALVTSRNRLAGLVARDGAVPVRLDVLPAAEARALLARAVGAALAAAEPAAVDELAELCGRLPLALQIAAANLTVRPGQSITDYLAQLKRRDRLAALAVGGDEQAAVAAAFDLSYHRLAEPARLVFRRLGLVPGPDVTAEAAAALAGVPTDQAGRELAVLSDANLLEEHRPDRYACHDLLSAYARSRLAAEETGAAQQAARSGLYGYYLGGAGAAADLLFPHGLRLPADGPEPARVEFPGRPEAVRWLDAELPNLVAAARQAAGSGSPAAWLIPDAVRGYLLQRGHIAEAEVLAEAGLAGAAAASDRLAYAGGLLHRAGLQYRQGDNRAALDGLTEALATFRAASWAEGQATALTNLGSVYSQNGQLREAAGCYAEALAAFERIGAVAKQAGVIGNLAVVLLDLGRLREAAEQVRRAVTQGAGLGFDQLEALNLGTLGQIQRLLGEFGGAQHSYSEAQSRYRAIGDRTGEGSILLGLAEVHCDLGQTEPARELAEAALRIARDTEHITHEANALAVLSRYHHRYGAPGPAEQAGRRALELARQTGERTLEVELLVELAALPALDDRDGPGARQAATDLALEIARAAGYRLLETLALARSAALRLASGEPDQAVREGEQALAMQQEIGLRPAEAHTHLVLSQARRRTGDPAAEQRHAQQARRLFAELVIAMPDLAAALRW